MRHFKALSLAAAMIASAVFLSFIAYRVDGNWSDGFFDGVGLAFLAWLCILVSYAITCCHGGSE